MEVGNALLPGIRSGSASHSAWRPALILAALLLASPIVVILGSLALPFGEVWHHLLDTVLPRYALTTVILVVLVAIGTFSIGVGAAWLVGKRPT